MDLKIFFEFSDVLICVKMKGKNNLQTIVSHSMLISVGKQLTIQYSLLSNFLEFISMDTELC